MPWSSCASLSRRTDARWEFAYSPAATLRASAASEIPESGHIFPEIASKVLQFTIIGEWQERMSSSAQQRKPCVVCAQQFKGADLQTVEACTLDLTLVCNPLLPPFASAVVQFGRVPGSSSVRSSVTLGPGMWTDRYLSQLSSSYKFACSYACRHSR